MKIDVGKSSFDVDICKSLFSHFRGLMFRFPKNDGLLFIFNYEDFIPLHMLFVFFPINIIYLNCNKKVIKIRKNVIPFVPYIPSVKCKYILELKNCKNIKVGDKLKF